ncbi:MAG: AraC family transcriptional regulator [Barnesiella sp.]|nr:AraC family transcriptional regulator [Barnesiella sp.]
MVCPRCVMTVCDILTSLGLEPGDVGLGYAILSSDTLSDSQWDALTERLRDVGFELITDREVIVSEHIKTAVIGYARTEGGLKRKLSIALEEDLHIPYKQLSAIFSSHEQRTIENYYISQRIEYVKELISYNDLPLKEIAYMTGYSSVAYLSAQFRKVTGKTVSDFRSQLNSDRSPLTQV